MNRFLHSLIVVAVLTHTIIGCCAHHECQTGEAVDSHAVAHAHAGTACPGQHKKEQLTAGQETPEPEAPEPCGHCDCSWVIGDTGTVKVGINNDFDYYVMPLKMTAESSTFCVSRHHPEPLRHQPLWPGLRAHLAMSILLV